MKNTSRFVLTLGCLSFLFVGLASWNLHTATASSQELADLSRALVYLKTYYYKDLNTTDDTKKMVEDAINGMLATLDPHTIYHSPESFQRMQEEQRGEFAGIGITFSIRNEFITVISVIENTPSSRLGLRPGDMIVKIEGEDAKGISSYEVVNKLRGKPGTKVNIHVKRPGLTELLEFDVTREKIPLYSVPYAYVQDDGVGYISISNFGERTGDELSEKITSLKKEGMEKLILDLRGNPGGLLKAAKEVSEIFLPEGVLIVETKGRIGDSRMELYSERSDSQSDIPVVVLIDGGSASASEIVSGAIQDHDRGLVVGTRSYGKGLVQRLYDLRGDAAVQVTTAQYYTPSGRCIQRPFQNMDYQLRIDGGQIIDNLDDPERTPKEEERFFTANDRIVYGGGGVLPDEVVEPNLFPNFIGPLRARAAFFNFALEYLEGKRETIKEDFPVTDALVDEFVTYAREEGHEITDEQVEEHKSVLKAWIAREIGSAAFTTAVGVKRFNEFDAQIQAAIKGFEEAIRIQRLAQKNQ